MAVGSVQNTSLLQQQASAATTNAATSNNNTLGKDAFMKLLVAQLKNQDPLNPTDAKEFVTQLSQLTGVEQMTNMADKLTGLQTATNNLVGNQASNLVGRKITADGSKVALEQVGKVSTSVKLAAPASELTVKVYDSAGKPVRTFTAAPDGTGTVTWDGLTDTNARAPVGSYKIDVTARDKNGTLVGTDLTVSGTVTTVSYAGGTPELIVGNKHVALADVLTVSQ